MSNDNTEGLAIELTEEEMANKLLELHGDLLHQLMQYPRFQNFVQANYDIQVRKDEEAKTFSYVVMERPHAEVMERLKQMVDERVKAEEKIIIAQESDLKGLKL